MELTGILIVAAVVLVYATCAQRLSTTIVTGPMIFLMLGWVLAELGFFHLASAESALHILAEVTLVIVLFSDASTIDVQALCRRHKWPLRTLMLGLPLSMLIGTMLGVVLLPDWPLWEVALIAAILAPTDAALGQAVVTNTAVPKRVRRALSVESGVNDGLTLPAVLLFGGLAIGDLYGAQDQNWFLFTAQQISLGIGVGAALGWFGGKFIAYSRARDISAPQLEGIAMFALAGLCYVLADILGGNGFLAAFAGGSAFSASQGKHDHPLTTFMEGEGTLLTLGTFLLVGLVLVPTAVDMVTWPIAGLVAASLFIVRPVAIWLSLIGSDASTPVRLFIGWFGPRGLATVLFALLIVSQIEGLPHRDEIIAIATLTALISALLHGATAAPAARRFGPKMADFDD